VVREGARVIPWSVPETNRLAAQGEIGKGPMTRVVLPLVQVRDGTADRPSWRASGDPSRKRALTAFAEALADRRCSCPDAACTIFQGYGRLPRAGDIRLASTDMLQPFIRKCSASVIAFAERVVARRFWRIKITLLSVSLSLFFAFPAYDEVMRPGSRGSTWPAILDQCHDPLQPRDYESSSHESKLAFRLTVPILAHMLGLELPGLLGLQFFCLLAMFYAVALLAERATGDPASAVLTCLAFALIFPGNVLCSDVYGRFDVVAYCLLALAMSAARPILVAPLIVLAAFTDERALAASGLVFLWFVVLQAGPASGRIFNRNALAVVVAAVVYLGARLSLVQYAGLRTSSGGTNLLMNQVNMIFFGMWTGLKGMWLVVVQSLLILLVDRRWFFLGAYGASILVVVAIALSVFDVTRSMGYLLPAVFISLCIVARSEGPLILRYSLLAALVVSLFPTYHAAGRNRIGLYYPFPARVFKVVGGLPATSASD
jgi:hypothetical protein